MGRAKGAKTTASLPPARDINPVDNLDGHAAGSSFLGKSLNEAELLFRENSLYYQEDLMWMGPSAFSFYLPAAMAYLKSTYSQGDSDIVNSLCSVLEFRLQNDDQSIRSAHSTIGGICRYVLGAYERFDVDESIYGNLQCRYLKLLEQTDDETLQKL
jgi:hypothetical protein